MRIIILPIFSYLVLMISSCTANDLSKEDQPMQKDASDTVNLSDWKTVLGINYNEQLHFIDFTELQRTKTTWVRGFIDFFQLYDQPARLQSDERLINYLKLKTNGYHTILNIKWNFKGREERLPSSDSENMQAYLEYLNSILEKVWYDTDILVVGNEPFIETRVEDQNQRLVDFYIAVTRSIEKFASIHPERIVPIFIGAFNNLYIPEWRTESVDRLLNFAKNEPGIAGIDLHIHHTELRQISLALGFVSSRIRDNQKILVTEFSLMKYWKSQLNNLIPENFAIRFQLEPLLKNYQYIDFALKNPRPVNEWFSYLQASDWFESQRHYLKEAYALMIGEPKFLAANYAIRQSYPLDRDFTATTDPWVLNGLLVNRTVTPDPRTGLNQFNYSFIDDFISIQESR